MINVDIVRCAETFPHKSTQLLSFRRRLSAVGNFA